jgi:hypothetical protein
MCVGIRRSQKLRKQRELDIASLVAHRALSVNIRNGKLAGLVVREWRIQSSSPGRYSLASCSNSRAFYGGHHTQLWRCHKLAALNECRPISAHHPLSSSQVLSSTRGMRPPTCGAVRFSSGILPAPGKTMPSRNRTHRMATPKFRLQAQEVAYWIESGGRTRLGFPPVAPRAYPSMLDSSGSSQC